MTEEKEKKKRRSKGEGTVYWSDQKQRYIAEFWIGDKRKKRVAKTAKEATRKKNQALADAGAGKYIEPSGKKLGDYLDQWLETKKGKVDDNTWNFYESHIRNHIKPELGKIRLKDLTHRQIQDFITKKSKTCSVTAVKRGMFVPLGQALKKATESERLIPWNPAVGIELPQEENKEIQLFDREQLKKFLKTCEKHKYGYIYEFYLQSGMRGNELAGLTWNRVDLDEGWIYVCQQIKRKEGKGLVIEEKLKNDRSIRYLMLDQEQVELLKKLKQEQEKRKAEKKYEDWNLVFCQDNGRPHSISNLRRNHFKKILADAGLEDLSARPHDLRHLCASLALEAGVDIFSVSRMLGHNSTNMVEKTYGHITKKMRQQSSATLSQVFKEIREET